MSTIDQQFVEYIVKSLVGHPDDVSVERIIDEKGVLLSLTVHPEDLGRVIGKRGITAQSLRTLLRALGTKNDARYNLKIVNTDGGRDEGDVQQSAPAPVSDDDSAVDDVTLDVDDNESEAPVDNEQEVVVDNDDEESDYAKKSRKELAELDDLDI
jgi:predicted RNA-binding protein YlqC (UPF0109 family)